MTPNQERPTTDARRRRAVTVVMTLIVTTVAGAALVSSTVARASAPDWQKRVNDLRAAYGLRPLEIDPQLQLLAQQRSDANALSGRLEHTPNLAAGLPNMWSSLGENVAVGPATDPEMIWNALLNSPSHRSKILDPSYTHIGIGETLAGGNAWVTQRFMQLRPPAVKLPPPPTPPAAVQIVRQAPQPAPTAAPRPKPTVVSTTTTTTAPETTTTTAPPSPPDTEPEPPAEQSPPAAPEEPNDATPLIEALESLQQ